MRGENLCVVGADAATEQERRAAIVGGEDAPIELLTASSYGRALGVEEEVIHKALVCLVCRNIIMPTHADGLNQFEAT